MTALCMNANMSSKAFPQLQSQFHPTTTTPFSLWRCQGCYNTQLEVKVDEWLISKLLLNTLPLHCLPQKISYSFLQSTKSVMLWVTAAGCFSKTQGMLINLAARDKEDLSGSPQEHFGKVISYSLYPVLTWPYKREGPHDFSTAAFSSCILPHCRVFPRSHLAIWSWSSVWKTKSIFLAIDSWVGTMYFITLEQ